MDEKLPKYTKNQKIGNRAAAILKAIMQKFCIFTEIDQSQDLGIDFIGTIISGEVPTEYNFNAQSKGSDDIDVKLNCSRTEFSYSIKVATINYWKQKKDVTILFLVDEKNEHIYWGAPLREIEGKDISQQETYTFHIPVEHCINRNSESLGDDFIFEIIWYYANFASSFSKQLDEITKMASGMNDIAKMLDVVVY